MWKSLSVLAIVPARGGSKGIIKKNLREICGKSLIAHTATLVSSIDWLDASVLSSDDQSMIDEAILHNLSAPFVRPDELSSDLANSIDVWLHAWREAEKFYNKVFDVSILLEPTSPLRTREDIERVMQLLDKPKVNSVVTVSKTPAHYTPEKTLVLNQNRLKNYLDTDTPIRQMIPSYYHRNGICYGMKREHFFKNKCIFSDSTEAVLIDRPIVNIDDEFELDYASWLMHKTIK
ncbi:MAG: CMP-N,N'-diacetyllegionaminic acid synthase [Enterobacterales bacterium]|jgi:CMP-N,N'-diacetyllegionaminic acid synthase